MLRGEQASLNDRLPTPEHLMVDEVSRSQDDTDAAHVQASPERLRKKPLRRLFTNALTRCIQGELPKRPP